MVSKICGRSYSIDTSSQLSSIQFIRSIAFTAQLRLMYSLAQCGMNFLHLFSCGIILAVVSVVSILALGYCLLSYLSKWNYWLTFSQNIKQKWGQDSISDPKLVKDTILELKQGQIVPSGPICLGDHAKFWQPHTLSCWSFLKCKNKQTHTFIPSGKGQ